VLQLGGLRPQPSKSPQGYIVVLADHSASRKAHASVNVQAHGSYVARLPCRLGGEWITRLASRSPLARRLTRLVRVCERSRRLPPRPLAPAAQQVQADSTETRRRSEPTCCLARCSMCSAACCSQGRIGYRAFGHLLVSSTTASGCPKLPSTRSISEPRASGYAPCACRKDDTVIEKQLGLINQRRLWIILSVRGNVLFQRCTRPGVAGGLAVEAKRC